MFSCTNGGGQEDCDDKVDEEARKPTSCGMISDPTGTMHPCTNRQNQYIQYIVYYIIIIYVVNVCVRVCVCVRPLRHL